MTKLQRKTKLSEYGTSNSLDILQMLPNKLQPLLGIKFLIKGSFHDGDIEKW